MYDTLEYFTFVLGYDLLHDNLKGVECDTAYKTCEEIAQAFMFSSYYKDTSKSAYENLQLFLKDLRIKLLESEED